MIVEGTRVRVRNFIKRVDDDSPDGRLEIEYTHDTYVDAMLTSIGRIGKVRRLYNENHERTPLGPYAEVVGEDARWWREWTFLLSDLEEV